VKEDLPKDPIRVVREQTDPEGDLGTLSRINYSKIYTVENYVRVLNIGKVHENSIRSLVDNSFVSRKDAVEKPRSYPEKRGKEKRGKEEREKDRESRGKKRR
jgi:predicted Zn-dependent peptidase